MGMGALYFAGFDLQSSLLYKMITDSTCFSVRHVQQNLNQNTSLWQYTQDGPPKHGDGILFKEENMRTQRKPTTPNPNDAFVPL